MDQNSHPTRGSFFSRLYTTQQPPNIPRSYLSTTQPPPSFFGRSHIPHSAERNSDSHIASAILQACDSSSSLPVAHAEDGSIYAGHKTHQYFSHRIEDTKSRRPCDNMDGVTHVPLSPRLEPSFSASRAGAKQMHEQYLSSEDLTRDRKQNSGRAPTVTKPNYVLTPSDQPLDSNCTTSNLGASPIITPKVEEGAEDDIPVSIRKSFKELRSVKDELERQRDENGRLCAELAATRKEASVTLARLDKVKQTTKRSIESSLNTFAELRTELASLKSRSEESFAFAAQARSALPDINNLRVVIKDSSETCHRIMEDLAKTAEMKGLIRDLELECANARKTNDFLRDKLTDITSQYADAIERLQNVECTHANQTDALRVALNDLHNANLLTAARTAKLDGTQKELSDALTACAIAKESVARLEKRVGNLVRDAEVKALATTALQRENAELQTLLKDRKSSVTSVLSLKEEILTMLSSSSDQRAELDILRKTLTEQLQTIGELNGRCQALERENEVKKQELASQINENATLRAVREVSNERESLLNTTIERLNTEKSAVETRSQALLGEIRCVTEERNHKNDRMTQLQMRCHALQERFEDQSATLKLARENHGDMQERLITAEAAFAVKLEAETGKLRQEVLAIQERNGLLQRSVDDYRRQIENQQELSTSMRSEYEKRLKDEWDGSHSHIQILQERMLQADSEKTQAVKEADDLRDSLTIAQSELTTLREQVRNIQTSISDWGNEVQDLTAKNHVLQGENVTLHERSNTIGARYDANDLSIEEKTLVNRILDESRSFHEKRIMDKQNELRRRDNQITEQEARIKSLEKGLARYLKSQGPEFTVGSDTRSILNLSKFASSSSPPQAIIGDVEADKATVISGTSLPTYHPLQTSSEFFKGPSNEVQSSNAAAASALPGDHEDSALLSGVARESLGDAKGLANDIVKLGKRGRPLSQASHKSSGNNNDATRPQRTLKSSKKSGAQMSEFKAEPEPKLRPRKRK